MKRICRGYLFGHAPGCGRTMGRLWNVNGRYR